LLPRTDPPVDQLDPCILKYYRCTKSPMPDKQQAGCDTKSGTVPRKRHSNLRRLAAIPMPRAEKQEYVLCYPTDRNTY